MNPHSPRLKVVNLVGVVLAILLAAAAAVAGGFWGGGWGMATAIVLGAPVGWLLAVTAL